MESTTIVFSDNTKTFREVTNPTHEDKLQEDLNTLSDWDQLQRSKVQTFTWKIRTNIYYTP